MDQRILQLGQALEQAAEDENWDEIRRLDSRISQLLQAIRLQGKQDEVREEVAALKRSHQRAAKICREQHDILEMKIQQHQKIREGLQAYALFSTGEEEQ
ncbi:hypothetical protein [Pantoea sp. BAV 3049]|uniref:hypothetical protein n=1 Tax=Pantoea sp. BAV 3049 TaxID=2654188 RepID=UPI00131D75B0|nr:hypothetical protein [Pantoea sp. BAV 3049]